MWRLLKWLVILGILAVAGLVIYAYLGPFLGVDFSPESIEIREPVTLHAQ